MPRQGSTAPPRGSQAHPRLRTGHGGGPHKSPGGVCVAPGNQVLSWGGHSEPRVLPHWDQPPPAPPDSSRRHEGRAPRGRGRWGRSGPGCPPAVPPPQCAVALPGWNWAPETSIPATAPLSAPVGEAAPAGVGSAPRSPSACPQGPSAPRMDSPRRPAPRGHQGVPATRPHPGTRTDSWGHHGEGESGWGRGRVAGSAVSTAPLSGSCVSPPGRAGHGQRPQPRGGDGRASRPGWLPPGQFLSSRVQEPPQ